MLTTLELRWFEKGTPTIEVDTWFNNNCPGEPLRLPEKREDLYLYIPECEYLNLKLRLGTLELKWRKAELGTLRFGERWEGKVEQWLKWICDDSPPQNIIPADLVGKRPWIGVTKMRSQRIYEGIVFELTRLNVRNDDWWSLAFEIAEEDYKQIDNFQNVVSLVSETYRGPQLLAENSGAYPSWLSRQLL